jgi:integrase
VSIKNDSGTLKWFVDQFGTHQVSDLTTSDLQRWRDGLVSQPPADADLTEAQRREQLRASQASANRFWTVCRAALNFAFTSGRVDADLAWRRLKPFQGVDQARTRFLSVTECNKLLRACPTHFGKLAQAALLTGLRPGELVRLTVERFEGTRLEVAAGKGKLRHVPLTRAGQAFFKKLGKKRQPGDLMLPNSEGRAWTPKQIARAMRAAVTAAKLPPAVFYDLRRSYGSLLANAGAGLSIIANALGHADTRMTKRHYAHLLDSVVAAELQAKLPTFQTRSSRKAAAKNGESAVRRPSQPA